MRWNLFTSLVVVGAATSHNNETTTRTISDVDLRCPSMMPNYEIHLRGNNGATRKRFNGILSLFRNPFRVKMILVQTAFSLEPEIYIFVHRAVSVGHGETEAQECN